MKEFLQELKKSVEELKISPAEDYKENNKEVYVKPKVNFAIAAYYKGTALEEVIKRLEEYLDEAKNEENSINFL